ncbi:MAG: DUF2339 domain-containing protein [Lentisphaeria bacterium]|nr:DUF2339 domain-containing protein [Lentisphaeria bacterium]
MEGAVVFCVIFLLVLVVLCSISLNILLTIRSELMFGRNRDVKKLELLNSILQELKTIHAEKAARPVETVRKESAAPEIKPEVQPQIKPETKPEVQPQIKPDIKPEVQPQIKPETKPEIKPERARLLPRSEVFPPPGRIAPPETVQAGPFEFVPDWITDWLFVRGKYRKPGVSAEYAAATAWLVRLGVLILLFGVGFLAKYMIEHSLFPPSLRVLSLFVLAAVLFSAGVKLASTKYSPVALGMIGLSFATGYLCIFTGSRLYGLIGLPWAYAAMIVLTAFCMTFSVRRDYLFPALIGVLGGYLTPFLLNTRTFAPEWQLAYLTVITAGVLFCAVFRRWNFLNWLALVLETVSMWVLIDRFCSEEFAREISSFGIVDLNVYQSFILLNFALFALLPTARVLIRREKLELSDILVHCGAHVSLFLLTMVRFQTGWSIPSFTLRYVLIVVSVLALIQLPLVRSADKVDRNWSILQLIFAAGALLCLIPVEFSVLWIVAGWMVLALILLALAIHLNSLTLVIGAAAACVIVGWRILIRDLLLNGFFLSGVYLSGLGSRMMGIGVFIAGLLLASGLMAYSRRKYPAVFERMPFLVPAGFCIGSLALLFVYSSLELYWAFDAFLPVFRNGGLSLWWGLWAILMLTYGILAKQNPARRISLILFGICAVKIFLVDLKSLHALYKVAAFVVLGLLMLGGAILYTRFKDRIFKN